MPKYTCPVCKQRTPVKGWNRRFRGHKNQAGEWCSMSNKPMHPFEYTRQHKASRQPAERGEGGEG